MSTHAPSIVETLSDFALPGRRLLPCDHPSLTKFAAETIDAAGRLPVTEKLAAARHITARAAKQGVALHGHKVAHISGDQLGDRFVNGIEARRSQVRRSPEAVASLDQIEAMGAKIASHPVQPSVRRGLLDILAKNLESFDEQYDTARDWSLVGIPDAAETVFWSRDPEPESVKLAGRTIREGDLKRVNTAAVARVFDAETAKVASDWSAFKDAPLHVQAAVADMIPVIA